MLTALPQLTPRVCHPNARVFGLIQDILIKLLAHYHQQTLWIMMAAHHSTHAERPKRYVKVLQTAQVDIKSAHFNVAESVGLFTSLTKELLDVCNRSVPPKTSRMSMKRDFKKIR